MLAGIQDILIISTVAMICRRNFHCSGTGHTCHIKRCVLSKYRRKNQCWSRTAAEIQSDEAMEL